MPAKQHLTVEGRTIPVSNLDKVLFPAGRVTKAQVIDYYVRIAPHLLPHLKNRPVTLKRYHGFEYLLAGYYQGSELLFVAKVKNGFVPALRRAVFRRFEDLETKRCPFANLPEKAGARRGEAITAEVMKKMVWLKPKLVAQVEFTEWTPNGHLRHSRFVALRDDKPARSVVREQP